MMEMEVSNPICVICCYPFWSSASSSSDPVNDTIIIRGGDGDPIYKSLKTNSTFINFLSELEESGGRGDFSKYDLLESFKKWGGGKLVVCLACLSLISEAMETRVRARTMELRVTKLQMEIMEELRCLSSEMQEFYGRMRRIEDNVEKSNVEYLRNLLVGTGMSTRRLRKGLEGGGSGQVEDEDDIFIFRKKITDVVADLRAFQDKLGEKIAADKIPLNGDHEGTKCTTSEMSVKLEPMYDPTYDDKDEEDIWSAPNWQPDSDSYCGSSNVNSEDDFDEVPLAKRIRRKSTSRSSKKPNSCKKKKSLREVKVKPMYYPTDDDADEGGWIPPNKKSDSNNYCTYSDVNTSEGDIDDIPLAKRIRIQKSCKKKKPLAEVKVEPMYCPTDDDEDEDVSNTPNEQSDSDNYCVPSEEDETSDSDFDDGPLDKTELPSLASPSPRKQNSSQKRKTRACPLYINIDQTGMSELEYGIIRSIIRRMKYKKYNDVDNSANPDKLVSLDLPVDARYPFRYDTSTKKITIGDIEVTLTQGSLNCSLCSFQTVPVITKRRNVAVESMYNHVASKHLNAFQCHHCPRRFTKRKKYKEHLLVHKNVNSCICDICGKPLGNREYVGVHKWLHLNEEEKAEAIRRGKVPHIHRKRMIEKERQPSKSEVFKCSVCGKDFWSRSGLMQHERNHSDETVVCPLCGKGMKRKSYITYHMRYSCPVGNFKANARRIKCLECENTFQSNAGLRKHVMRAHSTDAKERAHLCSICGKGYKTEWDMNYHARTHSQVRPWKCDTCGKDFNMKRNLARHQCRAARTRDSIKSESGGAATTSNNSNVEYKAINAGNQVLDIHSIL